MGENIRKEKTNNNSEAENRGKKTEKLGEDNLKISLVHFSAEVGGAMLPWEEGASDGNGGLQGGEGLEGQWKEWETRPI